MYDGFKSSAFFLFAFVIIAKNSVYLLNRIRLKTTYLIRHFLQIMNLNIKQTLLFNSFSEVGPWWCYKDVISPFSRIYLITSGEGWVYFNNTEFHLTPGKLLLIPKFTFHSYKCNAAMGHYYFCFIDDISEGIGMFDVINFSYLVDSRMGDEDLFKRINELNPDRNIKNPDPAVYDNQNTVYQFLQQPTHQKPSDTVESQGLMLQLTARFVENSAAKKNPICPTRGKLNLVCNYINLHLHEKLTLSDLANEACLSADYFSKLFNEIMGIRPMDYLNRKRIERAQMLLVTTTLIVTEIAEKVGIPNPTYFSTIFKKQTLSSPEKYKKMHLHV
jgi:AraC-like DNA-binding protein